MTDREKKETLTDIPDPGKLQEHGISIDAPTPTQFVVPDPWAPSGGNPPSDKPQGSGPATPPSNSDDK